MTKQELQAALEKASQEYDFKYTTGGNVPANSSAIFEIAISADAAFHAQSVTGEFTTLNAGGADGGANGLTMQWFDDGRDLRLFNDFIPCSLVFSPGRQRSSGIAGDPSQQLFFPIEFDYLFKPTSTFRCEVRNSLATDNNFQMCFHGTKYLENPGE